MVKNLPGMQETWVRSLDQEDPLENSSPVVLSGEFHGQRNLAGYSPKGHKESDTTEQLTHTHTGIKINRHLLWNHLFSQVAKWRNTLRPMKFILSCKVVNES